MVHVIVKISVWPWFFFLEFGNDVMCHNYLANESMGLSGGLYNCWVGLGSNDKGI